MATMSLRVGGKQNTSVPKLHGEHKKIDTIKVIPIFLEEAKELVIDCVPVITEVEKLRDANTVEQQLQILKLMANRYLEDNDDYGTNLFNFYLKLMTNFYLKATPKNPIKHAIVRIFGTFPKAAHHNVVGCLSRGLAELIHIDPTDCNLEDLNNTVNAIGCCFDNFTIGIQAVGLIVREVLDFLNFCLSVNIAELGKELSPTDKMEVGLYSHTAVRTTVSVLQKCQPSIKNLLPKTEGSQLKNVNILPHILETHPKVDCSVKKHIERYLDEKNCNDFVLADLLSSATTLLKHEDLPMDTRTNCGLVLVLIVSYLHDDKGWLDLISLDSSVGNSCQLPNSLSDCTKLCICMGLLNTLTTGQLLSLTDCGTPVICHLFQQLLAIAFRSSTESNMVLATTRAMQLLSRCLLTCIQNGDGSDLVSSLLPEALEFVWTHVDHYMDSVRHAAQGVLANLVKTVATLRSTDKRALDLIMEAVVQIPSHKRARYVCLSTLANDLGCQFLLDRVPKMIDDLIFSLQDPTIAAHVSTAFEMLMLRHHSECPDVSSWAHIWLSPLLCTLPSHCPVLEVILRKAVKHCPQVISHLVPLDLGNLPPDQLRTVLACLKIGRQQGALRGAGLEGKWRGVVDYSVLEGALYHRDEEIRLCALSLLVESNRSTETLLTGELRLVRTFLEYNMNTQLPSARQQALALFRKLLTRLKESSASISRMAEQNRQKDVFVNSCDVSPNAQLKTYNTFLLWLVDFSLASLFPGANFGRRGSALQDEAYVRQLFGASVKLASSHRPTDCITAAYLLKLLVCFPASVATLPLSQVDNGAMFAVLHELTGQLERELGLAKKSLLQAAGQGPMYGTLFCVRYILQDLDLGEVCVDSHWQDLTTRLISLCFEMNEAVACVVNNSSPEGHLPMDFQPGSEHLQVISEGVESPVLNATAQMVLLCSWRTVKEVSLLLGELAELAPIITSDNPECGLITEEQLLSIGDHFTTLLAETKHRGAFEQAYVGFCKLCSRLWFHSAGRLHQLPAMWLGDLMTAITGGTGGKLCATRRSAGVPFMVQALVTTQLRTGGGPSCFQQSMSTLLDLASQSGTCVVEARTHALNILRALYRNSALGELVTPYVAEGVIAAVKGFRGNTWAERNSATLLFSALMTRIFGVQRSRHTLNARNKMTGRVFFHRYPQLFDFLLKELGTLSSTMTQGDSQTLELHPSLYPVLLLLARLYPSSLEGTDSNLQLSAYIPHVSACARSAVLKTRTLVARALVPLITPNMFTAHLSQLFEEVSAIQGVGENYRHGLLLQIQCLLKETPDLGDINDELRLKAEQWLSHSKWLVLSSQHECLVTQEVYLQIVFLLGSRYFLYVQTEIWEEIQDNLEKRLFHQKGLSPVKIGECLFQKQAAQVLLQLTISLQTTPQNLFHRLEEVLVKMFTHQSYEVITVTLNFVLCVFENITEIDYENEDWNLTEAYKNGVHSWNNRSSLVLVDEIKVSVTVMQTLVDLALREDIYHGCRKSVFRLLHHFREAFLVCQWAVNGNTIVVMEWLLRQCRQEHENVGYAVLRYYPTVNQLVKPFSKLVGLGPDQPDLDFTELYTQPAPVDPSYTMLSNEQDWVPILPEYASEMCSTLLEFSLAERSFLCRQSAAIFLIDNCSLLSGNAPFLKVLDICTLWTAVLTLLQDDCQSVRELTSDLTHSLLPDNPKIPVLANKARELLLRQFVDLMLARDISVCVVALLAWSLLNSAGEETVQTEDRVFDKGEMNIFVEEVTLTELTCQQLSRVFHIVGRDSLLSTPLSSEKVKWFSELCTINPVGVDTIEQLIAAALSKVSNQGLPTDSRMDRTSHFLVPGQKNMFLAAFKIRRVVEVMCEVGLRGSEPAFAWRESGKPFRKTTPSSPNRDSNLDLPVLGGLAQHDWRVFVLRSQTALENEAFHGHVDSPKRDSKLNLSDFDSLAQHETSTIANYATKDEVNPKYEPEISTRAVGVILTKVNPRYEPELGTRAVAFILTKVNPRYEPEISTRAVGVILTKVNPRYEPEISTRAVGVILTKVNPRYEPEIGTRAVAVILTKYEPEIGTRAVAVILTKVNPRYEPEISTRAVGVILTKVNPRYEPEISTRAVGVILTKVNPRYEPELGTGAVGVKPCDNSYGNDLLDMAATGRSRLTIYKRSCVLSAARGVSVCLPGSLLASRSLGTLTIVSAEEHYCGREGAAGHSTLALWFLILFVYRR
uniref:tRNA (32-2'-O)-methyltransferase regulator THADA n=1 Tax=Timema cristinae TaxID=61476 RepID=A0A7R9CK79_TIMCR|nr:unnamed protein product [Timema cristinae]